MLDLPSAPSPIEPESADLGTPTLPTLVFASFKGGVWKTSLAVTTAERLAYGGLRVLLLTCDQQEDARFRLGAKAKQGDYPTLPKGTEGGAITIASAHQANILDILFKPGGTTRFQQKPELPFQVVVADMPPGSEGGQLSGVTTVVPVDGAAAARNTIEMVRGAPTNNLVILVKVRGSNSESDHQEWLEVSTKMVKMCVDPEPSRVVHRMSGPIPASETIAQALNKNQSAWEVPRRDNALIFLNAVESLVAFFLKEVVKLPKGFTFKPVPPRSTKGAVHNPWRKD